MQNIAIKQTNCQVNVTGGSLPNCVNSTGTSGLTGCVTNINGGSTLDCAGISGNAIAPQCTATAAIGSPSVLDCINGLDKANCNITISGDSVANCVINTGTGSTGVICPNPCQIIPPCPSTNLSSVIGPGIPAPTLTSISAQISNLQVGCTGNTGTVICNPCPLIGKPVTGTLAGDIDNFAYVVLSGNILNNPPCGNSGNNLCAIANQLDDMYHFLLNGDFRGPTGATGATGTCIV